MIKKYLSDEEKQFLHENYPKKGAKFCSIALNRSEKSIRCSASYFGLKIEKRNFINDFNPICEKSAYFLGFFCGDGTFYKQQISIEILSDDANELVESFNFSNWKMSYRHRENRQPSTRFRINSKKLTDFLRIYNFHEKSLRLPDLSLIPEKYMHLFILGLFDADGSIIKPSKALGRFQITSNYDYDWSGIINILTPVVNKQIKVTKTIYKKEDTSFSTIYLYSNQNLIDIYNYMYQSYDQNQLGLTRKKTKFEYILNQFDTRPCLRLK